MNKGFLQSSSWSSMNNQAPPSSSSLAMSLWHDHDSCQEQELPVLSWSQLLLGGSLINDFQKKKLVDVGWEDQMVAYNASPTVVPESEYVYGSEEIQQLAEAAARASWSSLSPGSCVTTNFGGSNMLDFSNGKAAEKRHLDRPVLLDHSSECNSKETGGAAKKIKVAAPYSSTFKVRKEKLGDRIVVLHQLVSPFGKTDTASVLLEAIGYIRFLQNQIEALSSPYLGSCGGADSTRQHGVKGRNCIFPEDPGQVDGGGGELKDLRSRGLCLVPLSSMCTPHVGGDAGADQYWAAASLAAGFL